MRLPTFYEQNLIPNWGVTYKLELLEEYEGTMLSEKELCKYGLKGGTSLEIPNCNNKEFIGYIKSIS